MTCPIRRLTSEPELFKHTDRYFVSVNGETVMVRVYRGFRWSLVIRVGEFKFGGDVLGYYKLSILQSIRCYAALRRVEKTNNDTDA